MDIINNTSASHLSVLKDLLSEADEVLVASPFCYADFRVFADEVASCGVKRVRFVTTLKGDEVVGKIDALLSFCREMKRIGVVWGLMIDNRLHGKVYVFRKGDNAVAAVISSANLTHNGMEVNHEWGVRIDEGRMVDEVEKGVLADVEYRLTEEQIEVIRERVRKEHPHGVPKVKLPVVDIADIVVPLTVAKGQRIFIKPYGSSEKKVFEGNFSRENRMYFTTKFPRAVRIGDILIVYAVGSCHMFGVYRVTSKPTYDKFSDPRWPWYVEAECMTPSLANHRWEHADLHVTRIANKYVESRQKPVTHRGGMNLNGLNRGCDKIRLDDGYGRYLLALLQDIDQRLGALWIR